MKDTKHKTRVFISYSNKDEDFVRSLRETLMELSDVVVFDPAIESVKPERIRDTISKFLRDCDVVIALLSPESSQSPNVLFELGMAVGLGKTVIPIAKRNTDISSIPFNMRNRNIIVSTGPKSTARLLAKDIFPPRGPTKETSEQ